MLLATLLAATLTAGCFGHWLLPYIYYCRHYYYYCSFAFRHAINPLLNLHSRTAIIFCLLTTLLTIARHYYYASLCYYFAAIVFIGHYFITLRWQRAAPHWPRILTVIATPLHIVATTYILAATCCAVLLSFIELSALRHGHIAIITIIITPYWPLPLIRH
jgi:hypothetical protein